MAPAAGPVEAGVTEVTEMAVATTHMAEAAEVAATEMAAAEPAAPEPAGISRAGGKGRNGNRSRSCEYKDEFARHGRSPWVESYDAWVAFGRKKVQGRIVNRSHQTGTQAERVGRCWAPAEGNQIATR
jgi:hypothetical protein